MYLKCYDFSGIIIGVQSESELPESEKLKNFHSDCCTLDSLITVEFCESLPDVAEMCTESCMRWHYRTAKVSTEIGESPFVCVGFLGKNCIVRVLEKYRKGFGVDSVFRHVPVHHILMKNNAAVFHASCVLLNGEAILFTAPSGTGKTTQAELWKAFRGAEIVNGDRCLVRKTEDGFTAGGIHYSGTSEYCENFKAPIKAVVLLKQAKQNQVTKLGGAETFRRLFRECSYSVYFEEDKQVAVSITADIINTIPVIELACLPDESAVKTMEDFFQGELNGKPVC